MGLMDRLLGKGGAGAASSQAPQSTLGSPQSVRKEVSRLAVREALLHNGIPAQWIRAEPLTTAAPGRDTGVHVRLAVQHWDGRLLQHAVALQDAIERRILALDPEAPKWLMGLSWQFALEDTSACPPLPHPGSWTASAAPAAAPAAGHERAGRSDTPTEPAAEPARRAELERLLGARDAQFGADEESGDGFGQTQPMPFEQTQPIAALQKVPVGERPQGFQKTQPMEPEPAVPAVQGQTQPPQRADMA